MMAEGQAMPVHDPGASFCLDVEFVQEFDTSRGKMTHVVGTLLFGRPFPTGTEVMICGMGEAPHPAVLRGIDLSAKRPKVGLHFLGISPTDVGAGSRISICRRDSS